MSLKIKVIQVITLNNIIMNKIAPLLRVPFYILCKLRPVKLRVDYWRLTV